MTDTNTREKPQSRRDAAAHRRRAASDFRGDIQGLRAIAVGAVVIYHLWPNALPGGFVGVDVFFVISGFLITGHLLRHPPRSMRDVFSFWARRIKRLLPASLLVLLAAAIGSYLWAPSSTWTETAQQIVASALYVENWQLASSSVDYLAAGDAPSPVQHFWSLSVEEQFYFVWPLLFAAVALLVRRGKQRLLWYFLLVSTVVVVFFAFSAWFTAVEPAAAYFITPTRMWELAAGGVVAAMARSGRFVNIPRTGLLAWVGLAMLLFSVFWINGTMPFPGTVALLPVVGTMLMIFAGDARRLSPSALLSARPMRFIGDISYAVYLWHWPLIVLAPGITGTLGWLDKVLILAASLLLGWLSTRFFEPIFRRGAFWKPIGRTFLAAAIAMAVVVASGVALGFAAERERVASEAAVQSAISGGVECFGAAALPTSVGGPGDCDITGAELLLDPIAAEDDKSDAYADGCWAWGDFSTRPSCTYGDGTKNIALVGNSHAGHWLAPLQELAKTRGWTITTFLLDRCNGTVTVPLDFDTSAKTAGCADYARYVEERTTSGEFDAVIVSERQSAAIKGKSFDDSEGELVESQKEMLQAWKSADVPALVIRDTPFPGAEEKVIPDCVAADLDDLTACDAPASAWEWMDPLATAAESFPDSAAVLDPTPWFCPDGQCHAVIGGVVVYFDGSHITSTYARTLTPYIARFLDERPALGI